MYLSQPMITIAYDYFENCIELQINTITDYNYPRSAPHPTQLGDAADISRLKGQSFSAQNDW